MKRLVYITLLLTLASGCVSIQIPEYIQDRYPHKKEFNATYDKTLKATQQALTDLGWRILKTYDPNVFEQTSRPKPGEKQVLIFTESKQSYRILYSRYARLNIYLRALKDKTEVEIRYAAVVSLPLKQFRRYKNNALANKLFRKIESHL